MLRPSWLYACIEGAGVAAAGVTGASDASDAQASPLPGPSLAEGGTAGQLNACVRASEWQHAWWGEGVAADPPRLPLSSDHLASPAAKRPKAKLGAGRAKEQATPSPPPRALVDHPLSGARVALGSRGRANARTPAAVLRSALSLCGCEVRAARRGAGPLDTARA